MDDAGTYGEGDKGAGLALMMKQWSSDVLLFTDGLSSVSSGMLARLDQQGIGVCTERVARLEGTADGYLLIGTDNTARKQAEEALLKAGAL